MPRTHSSVNISLPPALKEFLDAVVEKGTYGSASAVVQEALRLLQRENEEYEMKAAFMREALAEGANQFRSGAKGITLDEFKAKRKLKRKARLKKRIDELKGELDAA